MHADVYLLAFWCIFFTWYHITSFILFYKYYTINIFCVTKSSLRAFRISLRAQHTIVFVGGIEREKITKLKGLNDGFKTLDP